ncbi:hypothetical protein AHF37_08906 [Paragonimus kellicotti]|nr:hypothetical protein AHF37_08906 [Paragonimus kellicotti]
MLFWFFRQIEKNRKQEEYEAQAALKNRIHRLDEEEVEYLQTLAVKKHQVDLENEKEVSALLKEAQTIRPALPTPAVSCETQSKVPVARSGPTQRSLLANAVKRPSADSPNSPTESGPGLINYSDSDSTASTDSESESTDVEDAACTLLEVAATKASQSKIPNH